MHACMYVCMHAFIHAYSEVYKSYFIAVSWFKLQRTDYMARWNTPPLVIDWLLQ